jgi:peptide/nickel transport system substrate-binding protein
MIVPPRYLARHGNTYFTSHPIGTGAYMVTRYVPNSEVDLTAYTKYWRGAPRMKHVIYRFIPEDATRLAELQTGRIDIMQKWLSGKRAASRRRPVCRSIRGEHHGHRYLPQRSYGTDQERANPPGHQLRHRHQDDHPNHPQRVWEASLDLAECAQLRQRSVLAAIPYDPTKARALIQAAHLSGPANLTFQIDGTDSVFKQVAEVVVAELQQVGLTVNLQTIAPTILYNTNIPKGRTGICPSLSGAAGPRLRQHGVLAVPLQRVLQPGYSNRQVDTLLDQARSTLDQNQRLALYKKIDAMLP